MTHLADNFSTVSSSGTLLGYREEDEEGRQDPVEEDQQSCLVRQKPPKKQHGVMDAEAAMEMQRHLDETGLSLRHLFMSYFCCCTHDLLGLHQANYFVFGLHTVCTWFAQGLLTTGPFV